MNFMNAESRDILFKARVLENGVNAVQIEKDGVVAWIPKEYCVSFIGSKKVMVNMPKTVAICEGLV